MNGGPDAVPDRLADVTGPASGHVVLPPELGWTGRTDYDLDDPADAAVLYERVLVDAVRTQDVIHLLNAGRLRLLWSRLFLPTRVRHLWETAFRPERRSLTDDGPAAPPPGPARTGRRRRLRVLPRGRLRRSGTRLPRTPPRRRRPVHHLGSRGAVPGGTRFQVTDPTTRATAKVELGIDWRAHQPVTLAIGPVLHPDDAVASKVCALFSRAQARDYIDVDAVLQSGRYTSDELLALAESHDPGFDEAVFVIALRAIHRLPPAEFTPYGLTVGDVSALTARMTQWADIIES